MDKRKGMGITIFVICIVAFFLYAYLLMLSEWSPIVLQLSDVIDADEGFVVAITYPIHATTPRIPPALINTDNCNTIGLHSESINKYA